MEYVPTLDFYVKHAIKGLKYSLVALLVLIPIFFVITLFSYSFSEILELLIKTPTNSLDIFSILQGIVLFIGIPIVIAVKFGLVTNEKKCQTK